MAIVQQKLLSLLTGDLSDHVDHALVVINGQVKSYPIFRRLQEGNKITIYVYLNDEGDTGLIQTATLVDSTGEALAIKPTAITKGAAGVMIAFAFTITIQGGAQ